MRLFANAARGLRALGIKQGFEQAGFQFVTLMAGDHVDSHAAWTIYTKQLKYFLPQNITGALRDMYEIILDRRLYSVVETRLRDIQPDIILQNHSRYGQVGTRLGRYYNIPIFLDDITPIWEGERYSDRSLKPIARYIRKKVFSQATGLIAVSREMEVQLQSEGVPRHKIHYVPNGVDCNLFNPDTTSLEVRRKYSLEDKVVVGYVGGFQRWHRLDILMQAASSLVDIVPNIHFILVGDDMGGVVRQMARERALADRFTFPGSVPQSEVPLYLNAMDITVLPSTLPYMSPMKIYEYMAMGKPVVAPNKNSIVETVVIPNQDGFLFEAENADSMKNAIMALAIDPDLRQKMGEEARRSVVNNYTWYHQVGNLIEAFQSALVSNGN
jgi:glycosyltransferase involved in cell wall biosynthesis